MSRHKEATATMAPAAATRFWPQNKLYLMLVGNVLLVLLLHTNRACCLARTQLLQHSDGATTRTASNLLHSQQVEPSFGLDSNKTAAHNVATGEESAGNDDLIALEPSLLSVRSSLAFWRQLAPLPGGQSPVAATPTLHNNNQFAPRLHQNNNNSTTATTSKCQTNNKQALNNNRPLHHQSHTIKPTTTTTISLSSSSQSWHILAVEGTSLQVNFMLVGQRRKNHQKHSSSSKFRTPLELNSGRLSVSWLRNGRPLDVHLGIAQRSSASAGTSSSANVNQAHAASGGRRFSQQFLASSEAFHEEAEQQQPATSASQDEWQQFVSYTLANNQAAHVNEPLLNRLHPGALQQQQQSDGQSVNQLARNLVQDLRQLKAQTKLLVHDQLDDFVGPASEPDQVDWARAYAHYRHQQPQADLDQSNCDDIEQQLAIVRLSISQLELADAGQYQLKVCNYQLAQHKMSPSSVDTVNNQHHQCQLVQLQLVIVADIPRLESWLEPQLLEPGQRLSIKCQASGFTLPQISWFLDNQLISEHQHPPQLTATATITQQQQTPRIPLSSRFRIGDYVSQDNQVHSFINASHLLHTDGGFYKCQANNGLHLVESWARVDVRGLPTVPRLLPNQSVLVGSPQVQFQCPYSGHPISMVEWYFKADQQQQQTKLMRARRLSGGGDDLESADPQQQDPDSDPDQDEWLSQAQAMTTPSSDYPPAPDSWPDYPPSGLIPANDFKSASQLDYDSSLGDDYQSNYDEFAPRLSRRDTLEAVELRSHHTQSDQWVQFPQSRRHHIYPNGTLIVQHVSRDDQGQYKCRVVGASPGLELAPAQADNYMQASESQAWSNAFELSVQVPPVISPFGSSESLREGMRNFLTCSVIEGDPPVRLTWFKDQQPIEEYIELHNNHVNQENQDISNTNTNSGGGRIRVETTNEFTSTLYFQHVDFKDNGNYTCMASNKAASVNYTAKMLVNVPPKWIRAPKDVECIAGQNIIIDCQAQAYPNPRVWWEIGTYTSPSELQQQQQQQSASSTRVEADQQKQSGKQLDKRKHNSFPPNHYRTIISNSRTHILENASLVIRDVGRHDAGHYLCQAANNFGSLSALIKLTVNVGASFVQKYAIKYVKLNENVELDCDPVGQSPVEIIWFERRHSAASQLTTAAISQQQLISNLTTIKNTSQQQQTGQPSQQIINHSNFLHQQQQQLEGVASSSATFGEHSAPGRRLFMGTVRTELAPAASTSNQPTTTSFQQQLSDNNPFNNQAWDHQQQQQHLATGNQKLVELDASMAFELVKRSDSSELVRMLIKQAKRSHSADFVCQASNRYGADEKLIRLLVQEPPDPVGEVSFVRVDSRSISLAWAPPYSGNSPITSYTIEWRPVVLAQSSAANQEHEQQLVMIDSSGSPTTTTTGNHPATLGRWFEMTSQVASATIGSLQPKTTYEIRIRAHNQLGVSPLISHHQQPAIGLRNSANTNFHNLVPISFTRTTSEEAPSAPPSDVRATPLSSSSIQISWSPPNLQAPHNQAAFPPDGAHQKNPHEQHMMVATKLHQPSITGYMVGYRETSESNHSNNTLTYKTVRLEELQQNDASTIPLDGAVTKNKTSTTTFVDHQRIRVVVGELKRSTSYEFHVQAINSAGPGPQSDPIEAKTLQNDPPPAAQLRVTQSTYSSIELQWSFSSNKELETHNPMDGLLHDLPEVDKKPSLKFTTSRTTPTSTKTFASLSPFASAQVAAHSDTTKSPATPIDGYRLYYRQTDASQSNNNWLERHLYSETHLLLSSGLSEQRNEWSIVELNSFDASDVNELMTENDKLLSGDQATTNSLDYNQESQLNSSIVPKSSPRISRVNGGQNKQHQLTATTTAINRSSASDKATWLNHATHGSTMRYVLDQLACGSGYQIYLVAYNSIGSGSPSQIVRAKTRGSAPMAPRKPKEFISVNITSALLNLESWQDGGCSITNFEIRYRLLRGGRNEVLQVANQNQQQRSNTVSSSSGGWLLLSNNISPEQRLIELRDLEPETWYALLASGQSSSGKTEQEYRFMTLDKFGQLPAEAMEPPGSPFPASFFQNTNSNSTLRNLLNNLSPSNPMAHSLLLSGSMLLIMFISCLVFQMRHKFMNMDPKDSASIDSAITGVTQYTSSDGSKGASSYRSTSATTNKCNLSGHASSMNTNSKFLATNCDSPTFIFDATTNSGSNQLKMMDNAVQMSRVFNDTLKQRQPLSHQHQSQLEHEQALRDQVAAAAVAATYANQQQLINDTSGDINDDFACHQQHPKFNTLTRQEAIQMSSTGIEPNNRFRTMQHRPISTFIPNQARQFVSFNNNNENNIQQTTNLLPANELNNDQCADLSDIQHQQQIYSKLRLLYNNANSNYNITPEHHRFIDAAAKQQDQGMLFQNHADSINLSLLAQQEADGCQRKNQSFREQVYNSMQQQQLQAIDPELVESLIQQQQASNNNNPEFASFLIDCQQQHNNNDQQQQQQQQLLNAATGAYGTMNQSLGSAGSTSTNSHQVPTPTISQVSSSINSGGSSNGQSSDMQQSHKQLASNNPNINYNVNQQQQTQAISLNSIGQLPNGGNNEQSDYALPFPPKWV